MEETREKNHFVLVHGACHGAWCWYKVKPQLEAAGHRVTTLDMAASGINMKSIKDVHDFREYSEPLLTFMGEIENDEKVILVGHSSGGLSLALAMDIFPDKISVAVFVTAFMPDTQHCPSHVLHQLVDKMPPEAWMDTKFEPYGQDHSLMSMFFGPKLLETKFYQLSSLEDLELVLALARPGSLFLSQLSSWTPFSVKGYGSVTRAFIVCDEDKIIPEEFQRWMIGNFPVKEVMEINGADHMPMLSKPQEICHRLLEIANKYV